MKKSFFILIILGVVVALSGCGGKSNKFASNGIIITSFTVDPTKVYPSSDVYITADISNVGDAVAKNIRGNIIGLPDHWGEIKTVTINTLDPPEGESEGEAATMEWTLKAPSEQGVTLTYPGELVINYDYATSSETLIRVANRDWIMGLPDKQKETEMSKLGEVEAGTESGPIHTSFEVTGNSYSGEATKVTIDIQNVGGGAPLNNEIKGITIRGLNCPSIQTPLKLMKGEYIQIRDCEITEIVEQWKNIRVDIDLDYTYVLRREFDITVSGALG